MYGCNPSKHAVVAVCSVASLETRCGDSWSFSHNWGAIQVSRTVKVDPQFAVPHGDSSPITGSYVANFWKFPDGWKIYPPAGLSGDEAGAWKLLQVLLEQRPAIKAVIDTITSYRLAELMYLSGYYEGFHDPRAKLGEIIANGLTAGQRANIRTYAGPPYGLTANAAAFEAALKNWDPPLTPDLSVPDRSHAELGVKEFQQEQLDEHAAENWGGKPPLGDE
jgi:hypothetical protein